MQGGKKMKGPKKLLFALFLFLACCSPVTQPIPTAQIAPTFEIQKPYPSPLPSIEAFKSSENCPNICWLGIHSETTDSERAIQIISTSNQFNQAFTEISHDNIRAYWFPEESKTFGTGVRISFLNNRVESITLGRLVPFTVQDFIGLLGQPAEISLMVYKGMHDDKYTVYNLYYPLLKAFFQINSSGEHGPEPNDFIYGLDINTEYQDNYRQLWLGYEHFDEYMLRAIPTPTLQTPP